MALDRWAEVTLQGGPLDGMRIRVDPGDDDPGVAMMSDWGVHGPGGRSWYEPDPDGRWTWRGDTP
jgi:hypothetical protein